MVKSRYREKILALRRAQMECDSENKVEKDEMIRDRVLDLREWQDARTVLLYVSHDGEVDTFDLMKRAREHGKRVAAPRVVVERLELREIRGEEDLEAGAYGISEPSADRPLIEPSEVDVAIVPGIVFDKRGHRVGYGRGYYDRLLKETSCPHIGLAYGFQIVEYIPEEDYDVPVALVVTESDLFWARA